MNVSMLTDKEVSVHLFSHVVHFLIGPFPSNGCETFQITWINEYHQNVRDKITPLLGNNWTVLNWLLHETTPIIRKTEATEQKPNDTDTISTTHGDISAEHNSEI